MNDSEAPLDLTPEAVREEMLKLYPAKTRKKRSKQILVNDPEQIPEIAANTRTVPGIMTQRGCSYAGCRGVVMGPIYDLLQITHGPIGCGFYAWMSRRNLARPKDGKPNYMQYCMSTDMQEEQIVFGGEKKLRQANALDFDDLLLKTVQLFYKAGEVCEQYNRRFQYVLVDEYQDTNRTQYQLIRQLSLIHQNLCVVGDEDQSIYRWRGADIQNILSFEKDYPKARTVRLEQNYQQLA